MSDILIIFAQVYALWLACGFVGYVLILIIYRDEFEGGPFLWSLVFGPITIITAIYCYSRRD